MNRSVRSSRVTGPKMRVPIGSSLALSSTAALPSKRISAPSVAAHALAGAHDDRVVDLALLDATARRGVLDRHLDHVADVRVPALAAAEHLDAHDRTRARVVGDVQHRLHLDHDFLFSNLDRARGKRRAPGSGSWRRHARGGRPRRPVLDPVSGRSPARRPELDSALRADGNPTLWQRFGRPGKSAGPGRSDLRPPSRSTFATRHALVLLTLRVATISTRSPTLHLVRLVVRVVLRRARDDLAVDRMLDAALDEHGDRLVHLVADDAAGQRRDQRLARRRACACGCACSIMPHPPSDPSASGRARCRAGRP